MRKLALFLCLFSSPLFASSVSNPLATPVSVAKGGTNLTSATNNNAMVGDGTTWQSKTIPDCTDSGGNHINFTQSTNNFSCGTSASGGGGGSFALGVETGTQGIATTAISSSTVNTTLVLSSSTFNVTLTQGTTDFININFSSVTAQGNTFNTASKLVQLNSSTQYPALSGTLITTLNGANISSGNIAAARMTTNAIINASTLQASAKCNIASATVQGYFSSPGSTPSDFNEVIGNGAGAALIGGSVGSNTLFGYLSGNLITSGIYNVAVGWQSLKTNVTGNYNTAIGINAMRDTTGTANVAVGRSALYLDTTGNANTAIGYAAGVGSGLGAPNVVVSGSSNTYVGYLSGPGVDSGNNLTNSNCFGSFCISNSSNSVVLGAINGTNGAPSVNTNVGIGVAAPNTLLHMSSGTFTIDGSLSSGTYEMTVSTGTKGVYNVDVSTTGHMNFGNTTPAISSCGAAPSGSDVGSDISGTITVGGGVVTACTMTFVKPFKNTPVCMVGDNSTSIAAAVTTISASAVTFSTSATLGGGQIYYVCFGSD